MSTRAAIAKLNTNTNEAKLIYCHSDGYLEYTGKILNEHYNSEDKVDELLSYGDLSIINENIGEKLDVPFNDYTAFANKKQCRFYMRDRGEKNKEATDLSNTNCAENALLEYGFENMDVDFVYAFDTRLQKWYVYKDINSMGDKLEVELNGRPKFLNKFD
jgi:hypothetical protein